MATFLAGVGKGLLTVGATAWNLLPIGVKAVNEAVHFVAGPFHDAVHSIADILTVTIK